jgi:hypothetical protein
LVKRIVQCSVAVDSCTDNLVRMHRQSFELAAEKIALVENATKCGALHRKTSGSRDLACTWSGLIPTRRGWSPAGGVDARDGKPAGEYRAGHVIVGDDSDGD